MIILIVNITMNSCKFVPGSKIDRATLRYFGRAYDSFRLDVAYECIFWPPLLSQLFFLGDLDVRIID